MLRGEREGKDDTEGRVRGKGQGDYLEGKEDMIIQRDRTEGERDGGRGQAY